MHHRVPSLTARAALAPRPTALRGEPWPARLVDQALMLAGSGAPLSMAGEGGACGCGGDASGGCGCGASGAPVSNYYGTGWVLPVIPSQSVQAEVLQQLGDPDANLDRLSTIYGLLANPANLYLAREMCWVLKINGVESYVVRPANHSTLLDLIASINPSLPGFSYVSVVGRVGPIVDKSLCGGRSLPLLVADSIHVSTYGDMGTEIAGKVGTALTSWASSVEGAGGDSFTVSPPSASDCQAMFAQMMDMLVNTGKTDADRAMNYAALRFAGAYFLTWTYHKGYPYVSSTAAPVESQKEPPYELSSVSASPNPVQGDRQIYDVIYTYQKANALTERWYVRVDVTGEFPFIVDPTLNPYYT